MHELAASLSERYRITGVLGRGGGATTHAAERIEDGLPVAIKELDLRAAGEWKRLELFEREARVLSGLSHPGIPRYLELVRAEVDGQPRLYLVQARARGQTLVAHLEGGWRADEQRVRHIGLELLRVLVYLQSLSPPVIHRDIKPQNVLMTDEGVVSLVDFGAVRDQVRAEADGSTVVGTYGYMAPEQFRGHAIPATDLYGVGATLLYLLTRRQPADLPHKRLRIDFRSLVQVSPAFADWLERMVAPEPEERFASAKDALSALLHPPARAPASSRLVALGGAFLAVSVLGAGFLWWAQRTRPTPGVAAGAEAGASARAPGAGSADAPRNLPPATTLSGHWSAVFGLAWSSDGARLATGSFDQTIKLWDVAKAATVRAFSGQAGKVGAVALSPDDRVLVAGAGNGVRIWDASTGAELRALPPFGGQVTAVALSPDGQRVVASSADGTVRVARVDTGETVHTLAHPKRVLAVAATARHVVTGGDDGVVRVFGMEDGRELRQLPGHRGAINDLAVAPDAQTLATASDDGTVRVWVLDRPEPMRTIDHGGTEVWAVSFAADGKRLATGTKDDVLRVWDAFSGKALLSIRGGLGGVIAVAFSPDGGRLAASGANLVHVWSLGDPAWHPPLAEPVAAAAPSSPAGGTEAQRLTAEALDMTERANGRSEVERGAKALLERAIAADGAYARAHAVLGRVTYRLGYRGREEYDPASLAAAHRHFDRALELDPRHVEAHVWKGWAYKFEKKPDQAAEMARKADAIEPSSPRAAILLGELAADARDLDGAMRRARVVLESGAEPSLRAAAYGLLREVYSRNRDWDGVDVCYRSQIALEPDSAWHKGNYAGFLVKHGDPDRAIEMAKSALAQMPYPAARTTLADAYTAKAAALASAGKLDEATEATKLAAKVRAER